MNYIVLDLEWNQGTALTTNQQIPFEIVEIGAVKLDDAFAEQDRFQILIKPQVYKEMNQDTRRVVPIDMKELRAGGVPFREAMKQFFKWCGKENYSFCTWGSMDLTEFQRNLKYYRLKPPFETPVYYYDIQHCFGIEYPDEKGLSSLKDAVAKMGIEPEKPYHRALSDALCTVKVMRKLSRTIIKEYFSVDYYENPKRKEQELYIEYPDYTLLVSREFERREDIMKDPDVSSTRCIVCNGPARRRIPWHTSSNRIYYSEAFCPKHGYEAGKVRIRKTDSGKFYAEKTLKLLTEKEEKEVQKRWLHFREKRNKKKLEQRLANKRHVPQKRGSGQERKKAIP